MKARELAEDIQNLIAPYWSFLLEGFAHLAQKNYVLACESFIQGDDILVKAYPDDPSVHADREFFLGLSEIRQGKIQDARKRLAIITRILSESRDPEKKYVDSLLKLLSGEVLLAEGAVDEAIPIFNQLPFLDLNGPNLTHTQGEDIAQKNLFQSKIELARGYEMKGEIDKAIDVLERLIRFDPDREDLRLTPPKAYYELGRLYEKKGLKQKARESYRKFLDLWKNADPGLPEVEDVKKHLTALK